MVGVAGQIRKYINKGLALNGYTEEQTELQRIIQQAINNVLPSRLERMIMLNARSTIASATSLYLSVNTTAKLIPPAHRDNYRELLTKAEKFAVNYERSKVWL